MTTASCFLLERTNRVRRSLRRYQGAAKCSGPMSYHNAMVFLDEVDRKLEYDGIPLRDGYESPPTHEDPRWPQACGCGYRFQPEDEWQLFVESMWRRQDTGTLTTLDEAPPGAMWDALWLHSFDGYVRDGMSLAVKLPNGHDWHIDGMASNCGLKAGRPAGTFCWQRSGIPPNITVQRASCPHCGVGGGSVQGGNWHGFLTAGVLHL